MDEKSIKTLLECIPPRAGPSNTSTYRRVVLRTSNGGSFAIGIPSNPGAGQGRTTLQMLGAPAGAFYVWPESGTLRYPRALAAALGRDDLQIVPMAQIEHHAFVHTTTSKVIIDHACWGGRWSRHFTQALAILAERGRVDPPPEA